MMSCSMGGVFGSDCHRHLESGVPGDARVSVGNGYGGHRRSGQPVYVEGARSVGPMPTA